MFNGFEDPKELETLGKAIVQSNGGPKNYKKT